jgi:hypothetical protein
MQPGGLPEISLASLCDGNRDETNRRTYRDYVNDTGQDVAVEAGPNGPENVCLETGNFYTLIHVAVTQNHDMDYSFSPDLGATWLNNWNQTIANMTLQSPIVPASAGITIFGIPKYG